MSRVLYNKQQNELTTNETNKKRVYMSVFTMIQLLVKSHINQDVKYHFQKLKRYYRNIKISTTFIINKLHFLQRRKQKQYIKQSFNNLQNNRIQYYSNKINQQNRMKEKILQKGPFIILYSLNKIYKNKFKQNFYQFKSKCLLKIKLVKYKNAHIIATLSSLLKNKLTQHFNSIKNYGKYKQIKLRRLSQIFNIINSKSLNYLLISFSKLKIYQNNTFNQPVYKKQEKKEKKIQNNELIALEQQQKKLNQQRIKIQNLLAKKKKQSQIQINNLKKKIQKLQLQTQQLGFNNGLLEQSNQQLQKQCQNRKKNVRKKLTRQQIWQSVYHNMLFLLKQNEGKQMSKQQLLQSLQTPLAPIQLVVSQIQQQNNVLCQLLQQYKKILPAPPQQNEKQLELPYDILWKQNRYYYMVLQVLCEWGRNGSKQYDQIQADLALLQNKLAS